MLTSGYLLSCSKLGRSACADETIKIAKKSLAKIIFDSLWRPAEKRKFEDTVQDNGTIRANPTAEV